ncbi:transporter permease protein [Cyclospora cayetanensis]|uniref:Transporter permease protein n=1 Tax=Cyclospora cayetanensis TaxID=88456 RepID=A0A1D3D506_9EIME|nr:transporter permease protein [Cyclospora cayetanensis]
MPSSLGLGWRALVVVAVNSAQPLLVDLAKSHGSPHPSCCLFVLPIFGSMALVGIFTCGDKRRLGISHWLRASYICLVDLAHQALEKGVVPGLAARTIRTSICSVSMNSDASCLTTLAYERFLRQLSALQWFGLATITAGFSLRVAQISSGSWEVGAHGASEILGMALVTAAQILHGLAFVLNEKYMTDTKAEIEGPQLVFMCGVINTLGLLLWTVFWTVPRWEALVTLPRQQQGGSLAVRFLTSLKAIALVFGGLPIYARHSLVHLLSELTLFTGLFPSVAAALWERKSRGE